MTLTTSIDADDIKWVFIRASGPGGQHVNKASTAVQLRFNVDGSSNLAPHVRQRLVQIARNRMTADGILVIDARRFRSQTRNREDALKRLNDLVEKASRQPRLRKKTRPGRTARLRRLETKQRRSRLKQLRQSVNRFNE